METGMLFDIAHSSFVDGPGIRTTVFFKGCNLTCAWCHNPESQAAVPQMLVYENRCGACGICREVCPSKTEKCDLCGECALYCPTGARRISGKAYTPDGVLEEILKDKAYYESSGGGVTFSGGECMLQMHFLLELLKKCKANGIHTAVDTAGHVPFENFETVLPYTDLFLFDVKIFDSEKHKKYTGVDNERIFGNLKRLLQNGAKVWVRIPVIAGINDSTEEMRAIKNFLDASGKPEKTELLPYHAMGENKYRALRKEVRRFTPPAGEKMRQLKEIFGQG